MIFTAAELNLIIQALDIATRQGGLQVAAQLMPIAQKAQQAMNAENLKAQVPLADIAAAA